MSKSGRSDIGGLSPRRQEILALVAKGLTNAEISAVLGITAGTVRAHLSTLFPLLEVTNRTEATALWVEWQSRSEQVSAVLSRPALVVAPFRALGDDAGQSTAAEGLTRDLQSLFARWTWFPVIATGGRESDAKYRVSGELECAAERVRIWARVEEDGVCLWTERYDIRRARLFEVRDEIAARIVATAYPLLVKREQLGASVSERVESPEPWQLAYEGLRLQGRRERAANALARERLTLAAQREPTLALAHFGLGLVAYDAVLNQWGSKEASLEEIASSAERCIALVPHAAEGHYLLARHFQARGEHARGVVPLRAAVARNPSFAMAHGLLAQLLQIAGHSEEALERMGHAVRLGHRAFVAGLAALHFIRGEYPQALDAAEQALGSHARYTFARVVAAASAYWTGDLRRGREHLARLQTDNPGFDVSIFHTTFGVEVSVVERLAGGLRGLAAL